MMRSMFDEQLAQLDQELIQMGAMVESAIEGACDALLERDIIKAERIERGDGMIDRKERDIEGLALRMLLMQQPVARDLRMVTAAVKMTTDMERIGDQAQDIAEIVTMMESFGRIEPPAHIVSMSQESRGMVRRAIDAYVQRDIELAAMVIDRDDVVDSLFLSVKDELVRLIAQCPDQGLAALDMLMIAKYLERIADHATNIAEWVQYAVTGLYKGEAL